MPLSRVPPPPSLPTPPACVPWLQVEALRREYGANEPRSRLDAIIAQNQAMMEALRARYVAAALGSATSAAGAPPPISKAILMDAAERVARGAAPSAPAAPAPPAMPPRAEAEASAASSAPVASASQTRLRTAPRAAAAPAAPAAAARAPPLRRSAEGPLALRPKPSYEALRDVHGAPRPQPVPLAVGRASSVVPLPPIAPAAANGQAPPSLPPPPPGGAAGLRPATRTPRISFASPLEEDSSQRSVEAPTHSRQQQPPQAQPQSHSQGSSSRTASDGTSQPVPAAGALPLQPPSRRTTADLPAPTANGHEAYSGGSFHASSSAASRAASQPASKPAPAPAPAVGGDKFAAALQALSGGPSAGSSALLDTIDVLDEADSWLPDPPRVEALPFARALPSYGGAAASGRYSAGGAGSVRQSSERLAVRQFAPYPGSQPAGYGGAAGGGLSSNGVDIRRLIAVNKQKAATLNGAVAHGNASLEDFVETYADGRPLARGIR